MCPILATQRGERCHLWRYQFQAHPRLGRHQILLHSPSAGVGKSVCKLFVLIIPMHVSPGHFFGLWILLYTGLPLQTQETREILHFHYTTWPDFGVPESPASFLNFLIKVRESGCLNSDQGPVVVHCSAGIGRSGTFCLVDTCLLLVCTEIMTSYLSVCLQKIE